MEVITERKKGIPVVMDWIKVNFPQGVTVSFSRDTICELTNVSPAIVSRVILMLKIKGYLRYKQSRLTAGEYRLLKDVSQLTTEQIDRWVREYGQEKVRQQKARSGEVVPDQPASSIFEPAPATAELVSKFRPEVDVTVEAAAVVILTPAQQRLKEAQDLLEQAQREIEEEAKQQAQPESMPGTSDELLTMFDNRIESIEGKVNVMLTFFEQATVALRGLSSISVAGGNVAEEVAEPTTRIQLVRLVNSYAAAERRSEHETWKYLYGQFDLRTGLNAYAVAPNKTRDQSYLTVIEERGQIDKLYELARKLLVLPALR